MNFKISQPQQGSIIFSTFAIILVLYTAIFGLFSLKAFFDLEQNTKHICRVQTLQTESIIRQDLEDLFSLNSTIRHLRIVAKTAAATMVIAGFTYNYPLLEYARRVLQTTRKTQKIIQGTQRYLIAHAKFHLYEGTLDSAVKIQQEIDRQKFNHAHWNRDSSELSANISDSNVGFSISRLGIRPESTNENPPEYELVENFSQVQAMHLFWQYTLQVGSLAATPYSKTADKPHRSLIWDSIRSKKKTSCGATITGDIEKLEVTLVADKF